MTMAGRPTLLVEGIDHAARRISGTRLLRYSKAMRSVGSQKGARYDYSGPKRRLLRVTSNDGVRIGLYASGSGRPLLLVHGTGATSTRWASVLPGLSQHFRVYAMDRRGRGESGDNIRYHVRREAEDIAAVLQRIGEPTVVLGHSYGALCALEASLLVPPDKLILYEPPLGNTVLPPPDDGLVENLRMLLDEGEYEAVLIMFLLHMTEVSDEELKHMMSLPSWTARVEAANTIPREFLAQQTYWLSPDVERMYAPTLLMTGSNSHHAFRDGIERLALALPDHGIATLRGQRHVAMDTAPDLFVELVLTFLADHNGC